MTSDQVAEICSIVLSMRGVDPSGEIGVAFGSLKKRDVLAALGLVSDPLGQEMILYKYGSCDDEVSRKALYVKVFEMVSESPERAEWVRAGNYSHDGHIQIVQEAIRQVTGNGICPKCEGRYMDDRGRTSYFYHDKGGIWDVCDQCDGHGHAHPVMDESITGVWVKRCKWLIFRLAEIEQTALNQMAVRLS